MPIVGSSGSVGSGGSNNNAWVVGGNSDTTAENFLGTNDSKPFKIKTDGVERVLIDDSGRIGIGETSNPLAHIHIKSHEGYTGTGLQLNTFVLESSDTNYNIFCSYNVPLGGVVLVKLSVVGKQDVAERCGFVRDLVVYRNGGIAQVQNNLWQSSFTMKSNFNFNLRYRIQMDTLHFEVKNANPELTLWSGHLQVEAII